MMNDVAEVVEQGRRVESAVAVHLGEALDAFEPQLRRAEAGLGEQRRRHTSFAGHPAVQRSLPRTFLVALERPAGEGGGEAQRVVRELGDSPSRRAQPAAAANVPYTDGT